MTIAHKETVTLDWVYKYFLFLLKNIMLVKTGMLISVIKVVRILPIYIQSDYAQSKRQLNITFAFR